MASSTLKKIESPDGDYARDWGPPFAHGTSTLFHVLNHNKRGLALDLRDRVTREQLIAFILDHADVVLQNMRPGAVDKLGLGAAALRAQAMRLHAYLTEHTESSARDVAHSLLTTRTGFETRAVVVGAERAELLEGLRALSAGEASAAVVLGQAKASGKVVFVFDKQPS